MKKMNKEELIQAQGGCEPVTLAVCFLVMWVGKKILGDDAVKEAERVVPQTPPASGSAKI